MGGVRVFAIVETVRVAVAETGGDEMAITKWGTAISRLTGISGILPVRCVLLATGRLYTCVLRWLS